MKKTTKTMFSILLICAFLFNLSGAVIAEEASLRVYNSDLSAPHEVCEGVFFLKSVASTNTQHYYLTDFDYYTVTGGSFADISSQQWRLVDAGNGYYKIISVQTGFYLTARADANEGMLSLSRNPTANEDRQLWKFETTWDDGIEISYRIVSKAYENMCVGLSDTMGFYGHDGLQKEYDIYSPDYFAEWQLVNYQTELTLYYDNAFYTKFINKGMDAETTLIDLIDAVNLVYPKVLGLKFSIYDIDMVDSTPDKCKISNNYQLTEKVMCPANPRVGGNCAIYNQGKLLNNECENCTSRLQIYKDFIYEYPGEIKNASILFTGHRLYDDSGEECNRSFQWYGNGISMQVKHSPNTYYLVAADTLVHEIAHHIGAPDHYHERIQEDGVWVCKGKELCIECNSTSGRPAWCIMGNADLYTASGLINADYDEIFCEGCINDIMNYIRSNF